MLWLEHLLQRGDVMVPVACLALGTCSALPKVFSDGQVKIVSGHPRRVTFRSANLIVGPEAAGRMEDASSGGLFRQANKKEKQSMLSLQDLNLQANSNSSAPHLLNAVCHGSFKANSETSCSGKQVVLRKKNHSLPSTYRNQKKRCHIPAHSIQS